MAETETPCAAASRRMASNGAAIGHPLSGDSVSTCAATRSGTRLPWGMEGVGSLFALKATSTAPMAATGLRHIMRRSRPTSTKGRCVRARHGATDPEPFPDLPLAELIIPAEMTLDDLRRFAVARSLFTPTTLKRAINRMGFVQADPIRAPARAQDLTLRQRVRGYQAGDLDRRYVELGLEEDFFVNY